MGKAVKFWQVDAFTRELFKGNPAAVMVLDEALPDELMQNIAVEMNLSETAFTLMREHDNPLLRWFTPTFEIDLCGHATLASAHVLMSIVQPDLTSVTFDTKVAGSLTVEKVGGGYRMDFPVRAGAPVDVQTLPEFALKALSDQMPVEAYQARDLMLVYEDAKTIRQMDPDYNALLRYPGYIIATAPSDVSDYDFISRFFCADDGITEDPVTGSAHCTLAPYWAQRLGKVELCAYQASHRGGALGLHIQGDRLFVSGPAITVIDGTMYL